MQTLIDTNVWIDALAGNLSKDAFLKISVEAQWAGYSAITRLELFGFPGLREVDERKIREILLPFEEVAVSSVIIDKAILIRKKARIKVPDAIIAASALVNGCNLITRNIQDFKSIADLQIVDPFTL